MRSRIIYLIFLLSFTGSSLLKASISDELIFHHLNVSNGLSQSNVNDIIQDNTGFLWFATNDGLNRFDGNNIKIYRNFIGRDSIFNNKITCLFINSDSEFFAGTFGGGVFKYDLHYDKWRNFAFNLGEGNSISDNNISVIAENQYGLWIGTFNGGVNLYDRTDNSFTKIDIFNSRGTKNDYIFSLYTDTNGIIWIGGENEIIRYDHSSKQQRIIPVFHDGDPIENLDNIRTIYRDGSGNLWAGSENAGLLIYNESRDVFEKFKYPDGIERFYTVRSILEDQERNLWIGYDGEGIGIYNLTDKTYQSFRNSENNLTSLSNNSIYKIFQSNEGIMWLGNYGGGVNIYDKQKLKFKLYRHILNDPLSLSNNNVRTIYEDKRSNIWLGTRNGLELFDPESETFTHYKYDPNNPKSLSYDIVLDILEDSRGNLWIGTFSGGLNLFDRNKEEFNHYYEGFEPGDLSNNNVYKIFEDSYNNLWVGTLGGLNRYIPESDNFERFPAYSGIKEMFEDSKGRFYLGSDQGLVLFNRKDKTSEVIWPTNGYAQIFCIHETANGDLYLGTEGFGLVHLDADLNLINTYSERNLLPNNSVYSILEDSSGKLWLGTNKGIISFHPGRLEIAVYDESDGAQGLEYNSGSFCKCANGLFYFGGTNGFNVFNPDNIKLNDFIPPVLLSGIKLNNQEVKIDENSPLSENVMIADKLTLAHNQTTLTINFAALNYTNPHKNRFTYILEGLDEEWSQPSTNSEASFTRLPSGKYILKVKGSNNDLVWNEQATELHITVKPPLWQSTVAIFIYIFLIGFFLLLFKRYTLIDVKEKMNLKLEKIEREKQEELNQHKLTFFTNISHEFRTPLTLIIGPIERMIKKYSEDNDLQENLRVMKKHSHKLLNLINQLMDFRKIDKESYEVKLNRGDLIKYLKEITDSFIPMANEKSLDLNFFSETDECFTWFDPDIVDKIMYNLLSNAFKFTPAKGSISIYLNQISHSQQKKSLSLFKRKEPLLNNRIQILIKDTGVGIEKERLDKIFNRFYQVEDANSLRNEGSGIGLALTQSLVKLHQGEIKVESEKGKGTRFYISIPIIDRPEMIAGSMIKYNMDENDGEYLSSNISNYLWQGASTKDEKYSDSSKDLISAGDSRLHLLIADDDEDILNFLKSVLSSDYTVHLATHGKEAYMKAENLVPDLIIADVMMPEMDGIELCKELKENEITSHIPVILLTAKTSLEFKVEGFTIGADDYITKPFEPELLKVRINNIISARNKLREHYSKNLILEPSDKLALSADEKFLRKMVSLIESNMENPDFSVDSIIDEVGMSRAVLYRKLKSLTGMTVIDLVKSIRIKKAAILLRSKKYSISEVAYLVGFNDPKYFAKCFKKEYELSPKDYMQVAD